MPRLQTRVCDFCDKLQPMKLTQTYARWYPLQQPSAGYAIKLCDECVEQYLLPAIASSWAASFEDDSCPMCHDPAVSDFQYIWLTSFARNEDPARFTCIMCAVCAGPFRARFIAKGRKLEDRPRVPEPTDGGYWTQLGIEPQNAR